jgi:endonuclease/exonuclease/phosphatase (EEP) superfamily protein YafD
MHRFAALQVHPESPSAIHLDCVAIAGLMQFMTTKNKSWVALAAVLVPVMFSVPLVLGFFGAAHPFFDAFAHFRMHLAILMALSAIPALILGLWREGLMAMVLALTALGTVVVPSATPPAEAGTAQPQYKLMQLNLRYDNRQQADVLRAIAREAPDVITLQEVSTAWRPRLKAIEERYPYNLYCSNRSHIGGVAILSRRPFALGTTPQCVDSLIGLARIDFGGRSVIVTALHLDWPWPYSQAANVETIKPYLERLQGPLIIAGDFNAASWSQTLKNIADASRTTSAEGLRPSWLINGTLARAARWIGLPIDHILISNRIIQTRVETLPPVGSDHLPLLLRFSISGVDDAGPDQQTVMLQKLKP